MKPKFTVFLFSAVGCIVQKHLYEGRFTPRVNGKRISKNMYAKTREKCEEKLAELIKQMKAEIAVEKKKGETGIAKGATTNGHPSKIALQ